MMNLFRLDELVAMIKVKKQMSSVKVALREDQVDLKFCYDILPQVSRSFAAVICQLNDELRDAICIFYLVLRALDTVEDDTSVALSLKHQVLPTFHEKLYENDWHIDGIGKGAERELLERMFLCARAFQVLKPAYRDVISDICHRMAMGMLHFLEHEVVSKADYDLYCHYVAGLVGHGLTRIFAVSNLEDPRLADDLTVSNSMGLFLQKVNIIRDYFEDIQEEPPRMFWPREVWGLFGEKLADFKEPQNIGRAVECLNTLVADAMQHVAHCMQYLASLRDPSVFLFCAIPQVMAIATLAEIYNNKNVFCDKVKIRKGIACKIILDSSTMESSVQQFRRFTNDLEAKLTPEDPSYDVLRQAIRDARAAYNTYSKETVPASFARQFLERYPALGGKLIFSIVDSVSGLITTAPATPAAA